MKKFEADAIDFKKFYEEIKLRKKALINLRKESKDHINPIRFNLGKLIKKVINDPSIDYTLLNLLKASIKMANITNRFKIVMADLDLIYGLNRVGKINEETVSYISLHMYASNYDCLINFMEDLAKAIQKKKRYSYNDSKGKKKIYKTKTSNQILIIISLFEPKLKKPIERLFKNKLRNKIVHEDYEIKGKNIIFDKKKIKDGKIYDMLVSFVFLINSLQLIYTQNYYLFSEKALKLKLLNSDFASFVKSQKVV